MVSPCAPQAATAPPRPVVLITGLAGAGMSTALKALEDLGYQAIDNLPLRLLDAAIAPTDPQAATRPLALGIDSRTEGFEAGAVLATVEALRARPDVAARLLFLDCAPDRLQARFSETRRRHPLANDRPIPDGIALDAERLAPLKVRANVYLDTTDLHSIDLRGAITGQFSLDPAHGLSILVRSFSFKAGVPRDSDLVFDVRFLRNPFYDPALRPLTGQDPDVAAYVRDDPDFAAFWTRLTDLLTLILPRYAQESKSYLTLSIGCTGGRHRSVHVASALATWLSEGGYRVRLLHAALGQASHTLGG